MLRLNRNLILSVFDNFTLNELIILRKTKNKFRIIIDKYKTIFPAYINFIMYNIVYSEVYKHNSLLIFQHFMYFANIQVDIFNSFESIILNLFLFFEIKKFYLGSFIQVSNILSLFENKYLNIKKLIIQEIPINHLDIANLFKSLSNSSVRKLVIKPSKNANLLLEYFAKNISPKNIYGLSINTSKKDLVLFKNFLMNNSHITKLILNSESDCICQDKILSMNECWINNKYINSLTFKSCGCDINFYSQLLQKNKNIKKLKLTFAIDIGNFCELFDHSLNLEKLCIETCTVKKSDLIYFSNYIKSNKEKCNLKVVRFSDIKVKGNIDQEQFIISNIIENLESFDIHNNLIIIDSYFLKDKNFSLKYLNVSKTYIGYEFLVDLGNFLKENKTLLNLDISYICTKDDDYIATLIDAIKINNTLKHLNMNNMEITGTGQIKLFDALQQNKSLIYFDISENIGSTDISNALFNLLLNNFNLKNLVCGDTNSIKEIDLYLNIEKALQINKTLTYLDLIDNYSAEKQFVLEQIKLLLFRNKNS